MKKPLLLLLAAYALPALAQTHYPTAVADGLEKMAAPCVQAKGSPYFKQALTVADLNIDGLPEYIVDGSRFVCKGAESAINQDGGGTVEIYTSQSDGSARLAFSHVAHGTYLKDDYSYAKAEADITAGGDPKTAGNLSRLYLIVSGELCRKNRETEPESPCMRPLVWNIEKRQFEFNGVHATIGLSENK